VAAEGRWDRKSDRGRNRDRDGTRRARYAVVAGMPQAPSLQGLSCSSEGAQLDAQHADSTFNTFTVSVLDHSLCPFSPP